MDQKKIRALLVKFYNGETKREEEEILSQFFLSGEVPADLQDDKAYFLGLQGESSIEIPDQDFEERLFETLQQRSNSKAPGRPKMFYLRITGIAAAFLIAAGSYFILMRDDDLKGFSDQYAIEDPHRAYEEAKNTLLLVSGVMSTGQEDLQMLSKFDNAKDELSLFSRFYETKEMISK